MSRHGTLLRSLLLILSGLCLAGTVSAQRATIEPDTGEVGTGGRTAIQGYVYFPSGRRADQRIRVRLFTMTRGDMTTTTDDNGSFIFRRLAPGSYTIVIDGEKDYEPVNERVDIIQPRLGGINPPEQVVTVQIRLKLRGSVESKPGVVNAELANVPKRALEPYNKALEMAQGGDNKGAIEKLNQAISEYPAFMLAFNELGVRYMRLNQLDKANEALQAALKISPEAFAPLMNRGIVLVLLRQFMEAEKVLRSALKQKEDSAIARYYLGRALAYQGRFDDAEKELTAALNLGGDEMKEAHRYLGAIYNARGDTKRAIAELEAYLRVATSAEDAEQVRNFIKQLKDAKKPTQTAEKTSPLL